jgi:hypothetical protein
VAWGQDAAGTGSCPRYLKGPAIGGLSVLWYLGAKCVRHTKYKPGFQQARQAASGQAELEWERGRALVARAAQLRREIAPCRVEGMQGPRGVGVVFLDRERGDPTIGEVGNAPLAISPGQTGVRGFAALVGESSGEARKP